MVERPHGPPPSPPCASTSASPPSAPARPRRCAAALAGRDVLVVMPTGAGKSLCYQLPALMRDDLTVVVSPLVSLMQDQVEGLERAAPGRAALVNAQQDPAANRAAIARAAAGEVRLLYVAPERFSSPGFLEAMRDVEVGLFVVDEAHCVSQWGHDFRPDYFRLADAARWLGARTIVASTATATPQVAADIAARLGLRDPVRVTTGFDRPNLSFAVVPCRGPADKRARLAAALADPAARPAIVYAGTRADTARISADLGAVARESASSPTTRASPRAARATPSAGSWPGRSRSSSRRTRSGWASTRPTCAPSRTRPSRGRSRPTTRRRGAPGATGAGPRAAVRRGARQGPARVLHRARRGRRRGRGGRRRASRRGGRDAAARRGGRVVRRRDRRPRRRSRARPRDRRASRARGCRARRRRRRWTASAGVSRRRSTPAPAPRAGRRRARRCARAGASTARSGRSSRAARAGGRRSCATSATAARRPPSVPCCDVCAPELVPARRSAGRRRSAGSVREPVPAAGRGPCRRVARVRSTRRSSRSSPRPRPRSAGRGPSRSSAAGARRWSGSTPTTACRSTARSATCPAGEVLARVDALLAAGRLVSTGGPYPKLRVPEARAA